MESFPKDPESLAKLFHELYERFAPECGYETRQESAVPWDQVPEKNKRLMVKVCQHILALHHNVVQGLWLERDMARNRRF